MFYKKFKITLFLSLFVLSFISCSTVSHIGTDNWRDYFEPGHTKEEIARDFNLYRGKWWNYYIRGRWFAEDGYYDEAVRDFKKSISLRSKDQRSARSYGLHFWEYFVHRELGIVYYNQDKYEDAKKELEMSLSTADSARAKFYLNKCNEAIIKMTKADLKPPEIKVASHANGEVVNTPVTKLKGVATGDSYVNGMKIQGKRLFIELAEKHLPFEENISLQRGENIISLEATDFSGKSIRQDFKLTLDMRPPVLYLDDIQLHKRDGKDIVTVTGTIEDDYGVKHLYINNTEIPITPDTEIDFKQDIALTDGHKISLKAIDVAGNETKGEEQIEKKASSLWPGDILNHRKYASLTNTPTMIASSKMDGHTVAKLLASHEVTASQPPSTASSPHPMEDTDKGEGPFASQGLAADNIPPVVHTDLKPAVVHDANLFFSIHAHDDSGVARFFVNQQLFDIRPAKHVFFNHLLALNEGENTVIVKAVDTQGNEMQLSPVKITKKTFYLLETDARYTVALLPLRTFVGKGVPPETLYSMLLRSFDEEPKRFNFVERDRAKLEEILREQKITSTELTSPDTAIKVGKIRSAEGMLFGSVEDDSKGINVTVRLVDTETTQVLAQADVYDENKSAENLEWLMHGLSLKMKRQYPMVQGSIIRVSGNGFHVDAGATSGIRMGMKLLVFRETQEGNVVVKEPLDTIARITQIEHETSFARISSKGNKKIEKKDCVMTK